MSRSPSIQSPGAQSMQPPQNRFLPPFTCSSIAVPFPATSIRPYVPFQLVLRNGPFDAKRMWKAAVSGVRTIMQLSRGVAASAIPNAGNALRGQGFVVASGHTMGHLLLWDVDRSVLLGSCEHFNNATVAQLVITASLLYTIVENQNVRHALSADSSEVYVWDATTLELVDKLSAHEDRVTCIAVDDTQEKRLVSGGTDHLLFLWDLRRKDAVKPTMKLKGHKSTVSKVAITQTSVISAGGDGEIRHWNTSTGQCLQIFDGHQGQVTVLDWTVRPTAANHFHGKLVSACNGGLVRGWDYHPAHSSGARNAQAPPANKTTSPSSRVDNNESDDEGSSEDEIPQAHLSQYAFNKAHKSAITDVVVDKDIFASCSSADGVNFFNATQRNNFKLTSIDCGVRCLAMDPDRELLVVGTDRGQLLFFDYSNFVHPTRFHEDPVSMLSTLQPHVGAVTGLILERGLSSEWTRILTTSTDNSIFKIDFEVNRDAKFLGTLTTNAIERTACRNLLLPLQATAANDENANSGAAVLYDGDTMVPLSGARKRLEGKPGTRVVAMCYCAELNRTVCATDDGNVQFYTHQVFVDDDTQLAEEFLQPSGVSLELSPHSIKDFSNFATPRFLGVILQRGLASRSGFISIVDVVDENLVVDIVTIPMPVVAMAVHTYPRHDGGVSAPTAVSAKGAGALVHKVTMFGVVVQLRSGEVQLYAGESDNRLLVLLRVIVREQVGGSTYSAESSFVGGFNSESQSVQWQMPSRCTSTLNTKFEPPRVNLLYVEGRRTLRQVETPVSKENSIAAQFTAAYNFDILTVLPIHQGQMALAVVVEHSTSYITAAKGEALFEIHYDGSVADCMMLADTAGSYRLTTQRRQRSLLGEDAGTAATSITGAYYRDHPHCCAVSFSQVLRFVAFGYRDGMIQLWDVNSHRTFKRIPAHNAPIAHMWCFGEERQLMSTAADGYLRTDTVWPKTLRDSKNNTSPTPASTPLHAALQPAGGHHHQAPNLVL